MLDINDAIAPGGDAVDGTGCPVDWRACLGLAGVELSLDARLVDRVLDDHAQRIGRFQNTPYPVSLAPLVLTESFDRTHRARVESYVRLLEKVGDLVAHDREAQDYLGLTQEERRLVATPLSTGRIVEVCRLDGYVDATTGALKVLEHNSDSPAGTFFTPRLNQIVRDALADMAPEAMPRLAPDQFFDEMTLARFFATRVALGAETTLEVVQETGRSNVESLEMAKALTARGIRSRVIDPADIGDATVVWNKINTVYWRDLVRRRPEIVPHWETLTARSDQCHLNHFIARVIIENKRCLAFMQDPRHARLFTVEERALIADLCPWASICEPDLRVDRHGTDVALRDLLLDNKDQFVLKQPFDIRGDGVTVGRDLDHAAWRTRVDEAFAERHVCQEYVAPLQLPIVQRGDAGAPVVPMNTSLDTFVFGGTVVGYGAKASRFNRVNLFQGGRKLAVFVGRAA